MTQLDKKMGFAWIVTATAWAFAVSARPYPSVCLVFFHDNGFFSRAATWQRWYEDARIRLSQTQRENLNPGERERLIPHASDLTSARQRYPASHLISGFLHLYGQGGLEFDLESVPWWIRNHTKSSKDAAMSEVMREGLQGALRENGKATFLIMVPPSSIPVKRGEQLWAEARVDPRSRFTLASPTEAIHDRWMTLSREDATYLVDHPEAWIERPLPETIDGIKSLTSGERISPEEYWPLRLLINLHGSQSRINTEPFKFPGFGRRIFWPQRQFVEDSIVYEHFIGLGEKQLEVVKYGLVRYLHERRGVWIMSGIAPYAVIEGCSMDNADYFAEWVRIIGGDFKIRNEFIRDFLVRWYNRPNRIGKRCSFLTGLGRIMLLRAANDTLSVYDRGIPELVLSDPRWSEYVA